RRRRARDERPAPPERAAGPAGSGGSDPPAGRPGDPAGGRALAVGNPDGLVSEDRLAPDLAPRPVVAASGLAAWLLGLAVAGAAGYLFRDLALPALLAALLAYLLNPLITWAQGFGLRRSVGVGPLFAFFLLRDGGRMVAYLMDRLRPAHIETTVAVWCEIDRIIGRYLRGLALDAIIVGRLATAALWLVGAPLPLLLGAFTALMNPLPLL